VTISNRPRQGRVLYLGVEPNTYLRYDYKPTAYDDDSEIIPASRPFPKWFGEIIAPLTLLVYGSISIVTQHGTIGTQTPLDLHGTRAVALDIASVSMGLFLHCHYFCGNIYRPALWAVLGKIVSMIAFIGSLGYLLVRVDIFGEK
jgi:hypothetical protein